MTVHIAAAGENRGRVIVWMPSDGDISASLMADTLAVAGAYAAEIETLTIDDGEVARAAEFVISRTVALGGVSLSVDGGDGTLRATGFARLADRSNRNFAREARRRSVPFLATHVAGYGAEAIGQACRDKGPWNAIVVPAGEPGALARKVESIFATIDGVTAVIIAAHATRTATPAGPIVAVVEDHDSMGSILRVAERLSGSTYLPMTLIVSATQLEEARWLESQARLLDSGFDKLKFETVVQSDPRARPVRAILERLQPRFVIARYGGCVAPEGDGLYSAIAASAAAHFLVR